MPMPDGYKQVHEIAAEEHVPPNRVRKAIEKLGVLQVVSSDDGRLRYCRPEDVQRIREWLEQYRRAHEPTAE